MINLLTDLHLHSLASGHAFNTVDEIINFASGNGYELIGISDHGSQMEGAPQSGRLDVSPTLAKKLDYVIAGLHRRTPYTGTTVAENTASTVAAMRSGLVDIVSASRLLFAEARKAKVPLLFGSDAHHVSEMGITSQERERLSKFYDLDFDKLVNRDTIFVLEFLSKRHTP